MTGREPKDVGRRSRQPSRADAKQTASREARPELLYGGPGNDWLFGSVGDEIVIARTGADHLAGGEASDSLNAQDGEADAT